MLAVLSRATVAVKAITEDLEICKKKKKKIWGNEWLLKQANKGACNSILNDLCLTDQEDFRKFFQMNMETFQVAIPGIPIKRCFEHMQQVCLHLPNFTANIYIKRFCKNSSKFTREHTCKALILIKLHRKSAFSLGALL